MADDIQSVIGSQPAIKVVNYSGVNISNDAGALLSDVSFSIEKGEFVYVIGRSGGGKTTLLRSLYGDYPIDAGTAEVLGFDMLAINNNQISKLRRRLGIVFQNFRLLQDRSVYDNLYFVLRATGWKKKDPIDEQISKVLKDVGLEDKAQLMPSHLSEGEQQRVGVARALINNPDLIIVDEPTGNLDPFTSVQVMNLLVQSNKRDGRTVIVATHDFMMMERYPARVITCEDGMVR